MKQRACARPESLLTRHWLYLVLFVLWVTICPRPTDAQSSSAEINGTVTDQTSAVVQNVLLVLRNVDTGIERTTRTGSAGTFSLGDVVPGNYSLRAMKDGFATNEKTSIVLHVNQAATIDFELNVGSSSQTLTVTANLSSVESTTAEIGVVITTAAVKDLPLNGRNFTQLLTLAPGVSPISVAQNSAGGSGWGGLAIGAFSFPSVNGQRNRSNMFLLDGSNDLALLGNYNYPPIIDDIQEFKIQSDNDLAEFGGVTGGIINVLTKAGTSTFHGSASEFLRNAELDARNFFLPTRNPLRQNQFGIAGGGPVVIPHAHEGKNRTFFFFAYEGFRQSQTAQDIIRVPTAAELNGDFSSLLSQRIQLYNPFSTRPDPANPGEFIRDPFPGDTIPPQLLSPAAELYAKTLFPTAGTAIPGGNLYDTTPTLVNQDSYTGRIDQNFGRHDLLFGRISYLNESSESSGGYPGALSQISIYSWNASVHESHEFGGGGILDLHFGRNLGSDKVNAVFPNAPPDFPLALINAGFSRSFISSFASYSGSVIPIIAISGYASTNGNNSGTAQLANTYEFGGDFTKVLNRHTLKVGYTYSWENFDDSPVYGGGEGFSAFQTSNLENPEGTTGKGTGDALASFLLGVPNSSYWRDALVAEHGGSIQGVYAQDQYKISARMSLNIGVRYDLSNWPVYGSLSNGTGYVGDIDLSNGTYIVSAIPPPCSPSRQAPCTPNGVLPPNVLVTTHRNGNLHDTDYGNWQGRLGIAYRLRDATSLRAGYGRFYDEWNGVAQSAQNVGGTWPSVGALNIDSQNQNIPTATMGDPLGLEASGLYPPANPFRSASFYYDPHLKTPYVDQWNVQFNQQLGAFTALSIAYVGSQGEHLDLGGIHNTAEFPGPGDAATVASRGPFPYITPTNYDTSQGNSTYNALQVRVSRTTSKGLTYLISYTWSKSIDLACSGDYGVEGCELQNAYDPRADRSVSGFDLTHSFAGSFDYELPFGKGKSFIPHNRALNYLAEGWQLNGIVTLHSGTPYDVIYQGDLANTGNTFVRANLVGNPTPEHRTAAEWINTSAFAIPAPFTFGDLGRNSLRSDWFRNLDCSLFRRFPISEQAQLEFRLEAFNALNDVVFAAPGTVINGPNFGVVTATANTPRQLQIALKLVF